MNCSKCGKANYNTAVICTDCGFPLNQAPIPQAPSAPPAAAAGDVRPCPKCGRNNPVYAGFCGSCASSLTYSQPTASSPAAAPQAQSAPSPSLPQAPLAPPPAPTFQQAPAPPPAAPTFQQAPTPPPAAPTFQQAPTPPPAAPTFQQAPTPPPAAPGFVMNPSVPPAGSSFQPSPSAPTIGQAPAPVGYAVGSNVPAPSGYPGQPNKVAKGSQKIWIVLLVLLVILGMGAGGAVYVYGKFGAALLGKSPAAVAPTAADTAGAPVPAAPSAAPIPTVTSAPPAPLVPTAPLATVTPAPLVPVQSTASQPLPKLATLEPAVHQSQPAEKHAQNPIQYPAHENTHYTARTVSLEVRHKAPVAVSQHSGSGSYHIHILTSPNEQVADRLASALKQRGFNVHVKRSGGGWTVDTAALHSSGQSSSTALELRKSGYSASVERN